MRFSIIFILVFIFRVDSFSQKQGSASPTIHPIDLKISKSDFTKRFVSTCNSKTVLDFLYSQNEWLKTGKTSLVFIDSINSKTGTHYNYAQTYNGVKVYRGSIKVNCTKKGYISSAFDNTFYFGTLPSELFPGNEIESTFLSSKTNYDIIKKELCYFPLNEQLIPAFRIELIQNMNYNYETILDINGNILYQRDLGSYYKAYAAPIDSTIGVLVFNPDPLTTANVVYGSPYVDSSDIDITQLNAQRMTKTVTATYSGDTFYLANSYVKIKNFDSPNIAPVFSVSTPSLTFMRSQSGFEDVNAFYHISEFQKHIKKLNFTNLANYSIEVDAHAMSGADNSQFIPSSKRLYFGEGNVDDAEDADVIIHEYGHAISHSAAPSTNNGNQRQALDEGLGDYLASSYSRFLNTYKWENVFSWDGHNAFWSGRNSNSPKTYPASLTGNIYNDSEIWSSTLMQIWGDIGRDTSDEILLESLYSYANNISMANAAVLFIKADSNLYNGSHYTTICNRFFNRGLVSSCIIAVNELELVKPTVINSAGFAVGENLQLLFPQTINGTLKITDASGRVILNNKISDSLINVSGYNFSAGVYFITVQTNNDSFTLRAIRY